jgi:hypothetical protein
MTTKSLEVVIGADTSALEAKMAIAKASLGELNSQIKVLAKQAAVAGGEVKTSLTAQLTELTTKAGADRAKIAALNAEMREIKAPAEVHAASGLFSKLHENVRLTGNSLEHLHARLNVISSALGAFSELVVAGLGLGAVADAIDKVAERGEKINHLAMEFGATTEQMSALRLIAKETSTPFSQLEIGLRRVGRAMQEAVTTPTSNAGRAFAVLGVNVTNSNGQLRPTVSVLSDVATSLKHYADGTGKAVLVSDLFSARAGSRLIPVLNALGDTGIKPLIAKTKALGESFSATQAEADERFVSSMHDAGAAVQGFGAQIVQGAIPALNQISQAFVVGAQQGTALRQVALDLGVALKTLIDVATALGTALVEIGNVVYFVGEVMGDVIVSAVALAEALSGNFGKARELIVNDAHSIQAQWSAAINNIEAQEKAYAAVHTALWSAPTKVAAPDLAAPLPQAPSIGLREKTVYAHAPHVKHGHAIGGGGEVAAARHAAEQIQQIQEASIATAQRVASIKFQTYEQELNKEVAEGKITKSQEIQLEIQAANAEYQAQKTALDKKMALYPQESAAYAKAKDAEVELEASHDRQIAALSAQLAKQQIADAKQVQEAHAKAVAATVKSYQSIVQPINNAFQQTITGVLRGSETLQQGMQKAAQSIVLSFIQGAEKMAVTWAEKQLAMLVTTTTTQTAITAAQTAGHAAKAAQDSASIGNDAYKAAAGAYSAVVGIPIVGPVLAPAAAAAAFAGVMAFDVISAEGGMGTVPFNDMPALLHRNEMVLPASIAEPLRIGLPAIAAMPNVGAMMNNQSSTNNSLTYAPNIDASGSGMDMTALESMMMAQQEEMAQLFGVLSNNGSPMLPGR